MEDLKIVTAHKVDIDYKCGGNCPRVTLELPYFPKQSCCMGCKRSRLDYMNQNQKTKEFWTDDDGFWGKYGCRLPRDWQPDECKKYDCRDRVFYIRLVWSGDLGAVAGRAEVLKEYDEPVFKIWDELYNKTESIMKQNKGE